MMASDETRLFSNIEEQIVGKQVLAFFKPGLLGKIFQEVESFFAGSEDRDQIRRRVQRALAVHIVPEVDAKGRDIQQILIDVKEL